MVGGKEACILYTHYNDIKSIGESRYGTVQHKYSTRYRTSTVLVPGTGFVAGTRMY